MEQTLLRVIGNLSLRVLNHEDVYSNESHFLVDNVKNIIEAREIKVFIKNEFAQGAVGEYQLLIPGLNFGFLTIQTLITQ